MNSYNYDRTKESHLIKNSEWGAIAYLTHSQYGLNGMDIGKNSTGYISKAGGEITSSTGNFYGIYDLSGGAWEYTACFYKNGSASYTEELSYGLNMTKNAKKNMEYISNEYITTYNGSSLRSGNIVLFNFGKIGDSTKEVNLGGNDMSSSSTYYNNWFNDYSYFVFKTNPFFLRGSAYMGGEGAGVFASNGNTGEVNSAISFRIVLCQ